jgi:hypothetical protein
MGKHSITKIKKDIRHKKVWRNRDFWRRRGAWLSVAGTGVLIAVVAAIIYGNGLHLLHLATGWPAHSSSGQAFSPKPKTLKTQSHATTRRKRYLGRPPRLEGHASCNPAIMISESSLISWQVQAWMFPPGSTPSSNQIAQADNDYDEPDLVNQDLYNDGGYAPSTDTQLVIQNQCLTTATVTNIQVAKICQAPITATIFDGQNQLTEPGPPEGTQLQFYLDVTNPEAMYADEKPYDTVSPIYIPGEGTYAFNIGASALHVACRFWIQMTLVVSGKSYLRTFSDGGQPFRVSALLPGVLESTKHPFADYSRLYVGAAASPWHDGTWVREDPRTWP